MKTILATALLLGVAGCHEAAACGDGHANPAANCGTDRTATLVETADDARQTEADRVISQRLRQQVVGTDALSMNAKLVKVITVAGVVTLRGPVKTSQEKTDIGAMAQNTEGVKSVANELEVSP